MNIQLKCQMKAELCVMIHPNMSSNCAAVYTLFVTIAVKERSLCWTWSVPAQLRVIAAGVHTEGAAESCCHCTCAAYTQGMSGVLRRCDTQSKFAVRHALHTAAMIILLVRSVAVHHTHSTPHSLYTTLTLHHTLS